MISYTRKNVAIIALSQIITIFIGMLTCAVYSRIYRDWGAQHLKYALLFRDYGIALTPIALLWLGIALGRQPNSRAFQTEKIVWQRPMA